MAKFESEIERWERELTEAGWKRYCYRGHERRHIWVTPNNTLVRGPYFAWRLMKSLEQWPLQEQVSHG